MEFLATLGKNSKEINEMFNTVYGDIALLKTSISKRTKRFNEGRENCKDDARPGRPSTSLDDKNIDRVCSLLCFPTDEWLFGW